MDRSAYRADRRRAEGKRVHEGANRHRQFSCCDNRENPTLLPLNAAENNTIYFNSITG